MPFMDPTVQFDPEVKQYKPALEKFSRLLEKGELDKLPDGTVWPGVAGAITGALDDESPDEIRRWGEAELILSADPRWSQVDADARRWPSSINTRPYFEKSTSGGGPLDRRLLRISR